MLFIADEFLARTRLPNPNGMSLAPLTTGALLVGC